MNVEYILSHKEKSKKFADVILTVIDGESTCLRVAEESIYFLTGKIARNVNVFWVNTLGLKRCTKGNPLIVSILQFQVYKQKRFLTGISYQIILV